MAGAKQGLRWKREDLLPDFLPRQVPRIIPPPHGAREDRVAHDGDFWSVTRPASDEVGDTIRRVTGRLAVRDLQPAKRDDLTGLIALAHRRIR